MDLNDSVTVTLTKRGAEIASEIERFMDEVKIWKEGDDYTTELCYIIQIFGMSAQLDEPVFTNLRKA